MDGKILIVDDEKEIADLIEVCLQNDGYTVWKCYNGIEALNYVETVPFDLAILDVMLPDIDGFRICQKIREKHFYPIIMLTARGEDMDKIMGLTIGADDYITKPFNPLEVVARVKTQLRRYVQYNHGGNSGEEAAHLTEEYDIRGLTINKKYPQVHALRKRDRIDAHGIFHSLVSVRAQGERDLLGGAV